MRLCPLCNIEKPLSEFGTRRGDKPASYCKPCNAQYKKDWAKNQPNYKERQLRYHRKSKYGLTYEEVDSQDLKCQICGGTSRIVFDHDHDTGNFRGVLCTKHNTALGLLGDNAQGLQKAIDYLKGYCDWGTDL